MNPIICQSLSTPPHIRHGFFTREGGVSEGIFASLNCGPGSGDDLAKVAENRVRVGNALGGTLITCYQVHGNNVVIVDKPWEHKDAPQADALVTNKPGIALGILTADCLPVLFADTKKKIIGAAHAGWKGAFDGVIEATLEAMRKLGAEDIIATIGPSIAQKSYEVGPEFIGRFVQQDMLNGNYFMPSPRPDHHLFDLPGYTKRRLSEAGIATINLLAHDTCFEENRFFSYRRSCLRGEKSYGRQVSAICLMSP